MELTIDLPDTNLLELRVRPEHVLSRVSKSLGQQDIEVGDERFDGELVVQGQDGARIRRFLGPEVRELILDLKGQGPFDGVEIIGTGRQLRIVKPAWVEGFELLLSFIEPCQELVAAYVRECRGGWTGETERASRPQG